MESMCGVLSCRVRLRVLNHDCALLGTGHQGPGFPIEAFFLSVS